jgi:hypothetical protein
MIIINLIANQCKKNSRENIEWALLILSSALLGIWAVKETIALRNILLLTGTLLSIYYINQEFKHESVIKQFNFWNVAPIALLVLIFFWVIAHYLFFSIDSINQLNELKSTWLRTLLASIVGFGTGFSLKKNPNRLNFLWAGVFVSFFVLLCQYIPRALSQQKLYVPDYDHYLFHLKINTVLMGTILLAGVHGFLLDYLRTIKFQWSPAVYFNLTYWLTSTIVVLWSFVYIVNSKNGIGISIILFCFWFVCGLAYLSKAKMDRMFLRKRLIFILGGICLSIILNFVFLHSKVNHGWTTLLSDASIAIQIDRYPQWQNVAKLGYPVNELGEKVTPNNYERIAWATAGIRGIIQYPQGVGILAYPYSKIPKTQLTTTMESRAPMIATHSGWVELGLAFGIPILILIFAIFIILLRNTYRNAYPTKMTILSFVILLPFLYLVGEVAIDHGLEILFYLLALCCSLILIKPNDSFLLRSEK